MDKEKELKQLKSSVSDFVKKYYKDPALANSKPAPKPEPKPTPKPEPKPVKEYGKEIPSQTVSASASSTRYSLAVEELDAIDHAFLDRSVNTVPSVYSIFNTLKSDTFVQKMNNYMFMKNLDSTDVYNAAQIDRKLFSKISSDIFYKPAKDTCIAICLALKLTHCETTEMLETAGYAFSRANLRDVILEYFFYTKKYNIDDVNDILYQMNQKTLGR